MYLAVYIRECKRCGYDLGSGLFNGASVWSKLEKPQSLVEDNFLSRSCDRIRALP